MSCGEPCQKSAHMASEFSGRQLATGRRGDTGRREAVDSRVTSRVVYSHSSTSSSDVVYAVSTGRVSGAEISPPPRPSAFSAMPRSRPRRPAHPRSAPRTVRRRRRRSPGGPRQGRHAGHGARRFYRRSYCYSLSRYGYMKSYIDIEVSTIVPREPSTEARGQKALGGRVGGSNQGSTTGGGAVASGRVRGRRSGDPPEPNGTRYTERRTSS